MSSFVLSLPLRTLTERIMCSEVLVRTRSPRRGDCTSTEAATWAEGFRRLVCFWEYYVLAGGLHNIPDARCDPLDLWLRRVMCNDISRSIWWSWPYWELWYRFFAPWSCRKSHIRNLFWAINFKRQPLRFCHHETRSLIMVVRCLDQDLTYKLTWLS